MITISAQFLCQFTTFISHKGISSREQSYYVKWIRFYLDFCHKYNFNMEADKSLPAFMGKLREKKQSEKQRQQARHAVPQGIISNEEAALIMQVMGLGQGQDVPEELL